MSQFTQPQNIKVNKVMYPLLYLSNPSTRCQNAMMIVNNKPIINIKTYKGVIDQHSVDRASHAVKNLIETKEQYNMLPDFSEDRQHSVLTIDHVDGATELKTHSWDNNGNPVHYISVKGTCPMGHHFYFLVWDAHLISQCLKQKSQYNQGQPLALDTPFTALLEAA
jgi:hypothetical protein